MTYPLKYLAKGIKPLSQGARKALENIQPGARKASQKSAIPLIGESYQESVCSRERFLKIESKATHIPPFNQQESFPTNESPGVALIF